MRDTGMNYEEWLASLYNKLRSFMKGYVVYSEEAELAFEPIFGKAFTNPLTFVIIDKDNLGYHEANQQLNEKLLAKLLEAKDFRLHFKFAELEKEFVDFKLGYLSTDL